MKCCDIKSGDLKHKIQVLRASNTPDDMGGFEEQSLQVVREPWSRVKNKSGAERYFSDKLQGVYTYEFVFRYASGFELFESDVITYAGDTYNIVSIENVNEDDRFMLLIAKRGVANGS